MTNRDETHEMNNNKKTKQRNQTDKMWIRKNKKKKNGNAEARTSSKSYTVIWWCTDSTNTFTSTRTVVAFFLFKYQQKKIYRYAICNIVAGCQSRGCVANMCNKYRYCHCSLSVSPHWWFNRINTFASSWTTFLAVHLLYSFCFFFAAAC